MRLSLKKVKNFKKQLKVCLSAACLQAQSSQKLFFVEVIGVVFVL